MQLAFYVRHAYLDRYGPHYENTPIQIYRKFHLQKLKKYSDKKLWYFFIFLLET